MGLLSSVKHSNKLIKPIEGSLGNLRIYSPLVRSTGNNLGLGGASEVGVG